MFYGKFRLAYSAFPLSLLKDFTPAGISAFGDLFLGSVGPQPLVTFEKSLAFLCFFIALIRGNYFDCHSIKSAQWFNNRNGRLHEKQVSASFGSLEGHGWFVLGEVSGVAGVGRGLGGGLADGGEGSMEGSEGYFGRVLQSHEVNFGKLYQSYNQLLTIPLTNPPPKTNPTQISSLLALILIQVNPMHPWGVTIIIGRMERSAVTNLQMMSEHTHYLKDWETPDAGLTHQKNTRSCSLIFQNRHPDNSKYLRKASDLYNKKTQGGKRTTSSMVRIDQHSFLQRKKTTKRLVSENNSLPPLPKKTNGSSLLSFIFKRESQQQTDPPPQTYNTVNLYDILRQDENPEPHPPLPQKYSSSISLLSAALSRRKNNSRLRFDYELIKRKKFAMNIRYLRERNNQFDLKHLESHPKAESISKSRGLRQGYSHNGRNIFVNCNQLPKFGSSKYSLQIV